jgi:hypothetical protein
MVQASDASLVGGGDVLCHCYWMQKSGLAHLFPSLRREAVHMGERQEHGDDPNVGGPSTGIRPRAAI